MQSNQFWPSSDPDIDIPDVSDETKVEVVKPPNQPSQKEIIEHEATHLPYRNWCPVCVQAQGREMDHNKVKKGVRNLLEYSWDYMTCCDKA